MSENTLVIIFLRGGADGLTMAPPVGDDDYYNLRPQLAVLQNEAETLDDLFGLHPRLKALVPWYKSGQLALVHNAGSEDDTRSHFEAQDTMEHGGVAAGGWLGRYLRASNQEDGPLQAVSMSKMQPEMLRGAPASVVMEAVAGLAGEADDPRLLGMLNTLYSQDTTGLGKAGLDALTALGKISALANEKYKPAPGVAYAENNFANNLRNAAQLIKARAGVRAITIDLDGWDAHAVSGSIMDPHMEVLAGGLHAFATDIGPLLATTSIVVMTEFGRRVAENASFGTDHGRGSLMMVLGGGVQGGRVYHAWNGLAADTLDGPGDLPVHFNYRDVLLPVLTRQGRPFAAASIFPNHKPAPVPLYA